jgi:hypothetical protein
MNELNYLYLVKNRQTSRTFVGYNMRCKICRDAYSKEDFTIPSFRICSKCRKKLNINTVNSYKLGRMKKAYNKL